MFFFLSVIGVIIGFVVFINFISAGDDLKRAINGKGSKGNNNSERPRLDAGKVLRNNSDTGQPRPRICPVCGTLLDQSEYLLASIEPGDDNRKRQAHIYGCKYCFTTSGVNLNKEKITSIEP